jgi:hypothetical protein
MKVDIKSFRRRHLMRTIQTCEIFALANPNKAWVVKEVEVLRREWIAWLETSQKLGVSPDFNPLTCSEAIKDGYENRRKHHRLREKTLVFIANNFSGYGFLFENWPTYPHEDNTGRLAEIVPGWIERLDTLNACIEYARVPDGFWKEQGKKLVSKIAEVGPEKAVEVAEKFLRNPGADYTP